MLSRKSSSSRPKQQSLFRRIVQTILPNKLNQPKVPVPPMAQQENGNTSVSPLYKRLHVPEEEERKGEPNPYLPTTPQETPQLTLNGPIPRRPIAEYPAFQTDPSLIAFAQEAGLAFLTPIEALVLSLMLNSQRASHFRPVLEPQIELLLVHKFDLIPLTRVRELVHDLPDAEKGLLERDLKVHLLSQQRFVLGLLLWNDGIVVTTSTRGSRMEVDKELERPSSAAMFGPWRREWDDVPDPKAKFKSRRVFVDGNGRI